MISEELKRKFSEAQSNVFVDQNALRSLLSQAEQGEIAEGQAEQRLRQLDPGRSGAVLLADRRLDDEWGALIEVIDAAERRTKNIARGQYRVALAAVPVFVSVVLLSFFLGWHRSEGSAVIASVVAASLVAIGSHSFFAMRVQQQASLAAERLSEKRLGILFLRIAITRKDPQESARLLDAGTKMFLGHHAAQTIPLQAEDLSAAHKP